MVQIGKYKRPGIFIEEFDNSAIQTPTVQGLSTMVIGFSRKGPVNNPVLLNTTSDLEKIFGSIDTNMEKKGSYFQRTIAKMLESSPVWAMNLLATDDTLDLLEYKSMSTSTQYLNDVVRTGPYRRFFDTTGFWTKDTEAFLNLVKTNPGASTRVIQFTNMSDKTITAFVFKSKITGYNQTMLDYYGSVDKVPTYVYTNDYVSDYMIDVVVVSGDWSNYPVLAVDTKWGNYFNTTGLRKDQVVNFVNDRNVNVLGYYEGVSLIPYFRNKNGSNIFVETILNRDTDKTGLFCAFNAEMLETDTPNGLIDIIGNNLIANDDITDIEFLSYKDAILESMPYSNTYLDRAGNVTAINGTMSTLRSGTSSTIRSAYYAEGFVSGVSATHSSSTASATITYGVASGAYTVIGGVKHNISATGSFTIDPSTYIGITASTLTYSTTYAIDTTGTIVKYENTTNSANISVNTTDIVLGQIVFGIQTISGVNQITGSPIFNDITVNTTGYVELLVGTDYTVTNNGSGSFTIEMLGTNATAVTSNYKQYRRIKFFNYLTNLLSSPNKNQMTMLIDNNVKASLANMTITNIVSSTTANKKFTLNTGLTSGTTDLAKGVLCFYTIDDEFVLASYGMITKDTPAIISGTSTDDGVVAKYSTFYKNYNDGLIESGDYFYENILGASYDISFADYSGTDYIIFYDSTGFFTGLPVFVTNQKVIVPDSVSNVGTFTITDPNNKATLIGLTPSGNYRAYILAENTVAETVTSSTLYDAQIKHFLKAYLDGSNNLHVAFTDSLLQSAEPIQDLAKNTTISVKSQKTNYRQGVEIEVPSGYVQSPNKILVNGTRYTEIKNGDYLEAYVAPENDPLDIAYVSTNGIPKRLTRIISKKLYAADTTLIEITCDARIKTYSYNGDLQTNRITSVDDYVNTYKAITLKGFKIRQDSMPDGTEERQNRILNLVATGTNLFKALTDKEAISFRYLIDSFGLGLTELSKQQYADICGARLDVFGFVNMPSMRSFKNSTSPTFVDSEGVLQTSFIAQGGDPESNPAFLYSLAEGTGVSTIGYFTPYVIVNDNGRPTEFPPASFVATTYMRKINSNQTNVTPWTIAAGVTNGVVTGIAGLEMNFNNEDIENFNGMHVNPIVSKKNRGFVIETENTAQTLIRSALSFIHVREVLIELEGELGAMLLNYQWKYNTPDVRAEIKLKADSICERFVNRNGLYNFFNKIDEENNTSEIIDNQMGVLDTYVEPIKGMGIIVNNITVLRTGAIQSGGFLNP
jgi:hypothetical protein